jgi:putative membrane protein
MKKLLLGFGQSTTSTQRDRERMIAYRYRPYKIGSREASMIANYTNHAANERTFLAWLRTGLAVTAFGFFLAKLNVFLDAVAGPRLAHLPGRAGAVVAAVGHHVGLILGLIGIAIILRGGVGFERTRREINREGVTRLPQSYAEPVLSAALSIAAAMFCIYLAFQ